MNIDELAVFLAGSRTETQSIGLFDGKMGWVIFLFHYARLRDSEEYEDIAMDLLSDVYSRIYTSTSVDYSTGLSGVGVGIEYLIRNGFVKGDANLILRDIDRLMFQASIYQDNFDNGLEHGLLGWIKYYQFRISGNTEKNELMCNLINKQNLIHLIDRFEKQKKTVANVDILISVLYDVLLLGVFNSKVDNLLRYYLNIPLLNRSELHQLAANLSESRLVGLSFDSTYGLKGIIGETMALTNEFDFDILSWKKLL